MAKRRVMLKLSGEALAGDKHFGFDDDTIRGVAKQVKAAVDEGVQIAIVIGGGNFWRGRQSKEVDRYKADQVGILATIMNCIYVSELFRIEGMKTKVMSSIEIGDMAELFNKVFRRIPVSSFGLSSLNVMRFFLQRQSMAYMTLIRRRIQRQRNIPSFRSLRSLTSGSV